MKTYSLSNDVFAVVVLTTLAVALVGSAEEAAGACYVAAAVAVHRLWTFVGRPWVDRRRSSPPPSEA